MCGFFFESNKNYFTWFVLEVLYQEISSLRIYQHFPMQSNFLDGHRFENDREVWKDLWQIGSLQTLGPSIIGEGKLSPYLTTNASVVAGTMW